MAIKEIFDEKGIFICDRCKDKLHIELSDEVFKELKNIINKKYSTNKLSFCYFCRSQEFVTKGLMLDRKWIADSLNASINKSDEFLKDLKKGIVICPYCKRKGNLELNKCFYCKTEVDLKDYKKKYCMPFTHRLMLKGLVSLFQGKSTVPNKFNLK